MMRVESPLYVAFSVQIFFTCFPPLRNFGGQRICLEPPLQDAQRCLSLPLCWGRLFEPWIEIQLELLFLSVSCPKRVTPFPIGRGAGDGVEEVYWEADLLFVQ